MSVQCNDDLTPNLIWVQRWNELLNQEVAIANVLAVQGSQETRTQFLNEARQLLPHRVPYPDPPVCAYYRLLSYNH